MGRRRALLQTMGGPLRRQASLRSPLSLVTPCTCKERLSVCGLYCSVMRRYTLPLSGCNKTMPPLSRRGELGKVVIGSSTGCMHLLETRNHVFESGEQNFGLINRPAWKINGVIKRSPDIIPEVDLDCF